MNYRTLTGIIRISRPVNVVIIFFAVIIASWCAGVLANNYSIVIVAALSAALVGAGANAINDVFDIEIDKINKPHRPLPSNQITIQQAKYFWLVTSLLAIIANTILPLQSFLIVVAAVTLLFFYSKYFKRLPLIGNVIISVLTGLTFLYGGSLIGQYDRALIPALFAFITNLTRELVKNIEDIEGDKASGAKTFAVLFGIVPSQLFVTILIILTAILSYVVIESALYNRAFTILVTVANAIFFISLYFIWSKQDLRNFSKASMLIKTGMVTGLISIVAGSVGR